MRVRHSSVGLRADANRRWSLNDALTFGLQVSNLDLQYVEEPVADPMADLAAFHCTTGVPVALDESVDEALLRAPRSATRGGGGFGDDVGDQSHKANVGGVGGAAWAWGALAELMEPTFGVAALVLKPSVLGGFETCAAAAAAARSHGIAAVVTTTFDSGVGTAACAQLAAALDAAALDAAAEAKAAAAATAEAAAAAAGVGVGTYISGSASSSSPFASGMWDEGGYEVGPVGYRVACLSLVTLCSIVYSPVRFHSTRVHVRNFLADVLRFFSSFLLVVFWFFLSSKNLLHRSSSCDATRRTRRTRVRWSVVWESCNTASVPGRGWMAT